VLQRVYDDDHNGDSDDEFPFKKKDVKDTQDDWKNGHLELLKEAFLNGRKALKLYFDDLDDDRDEVLILLLSLELSYHCSFIAVLYCYLLFFVVPMIRTSST
jgi:hypothetical protein